MSLFRRNRRARADGDQAAAAAPAATAVAPHGEHAELDALVGQAPSSRRRGKLRGRLRHLRRVREVLLRDLGGLTFELHRSGGGASGAILEGKLARLSSVDREIRELEAHLADHRAMIVREPGIGGTCAECGELFGSEARFCWACGNPVAAGAGGAPHLAAWTTHPQLTGAAPAAAAPLQAPSVDSTWVEQAAEEHPTAPLPLMDPDEVAATAPAVNEPATGDVGGESGAVWSDHVPPAPDDMRPPADHTPPASDDMPPASDDMPPPSDDMPPPSDHMPPPAFDHMPPPPEDAPAREDAAPEVSAGDPLASPQRPAS